MEFAEIASWTAFHCGKLVHQGFLRALSIGILVQELVGALFFLEVPIALRK